MLVILQKKQGMDVQAFLQFLNGSEIIRKKNASPKKTGATPKRGTRLKV
jgi:hypothetical protein